MPILIHRNTLFLFHQSTFQSSEHFSPLMLLIKARNASHAYFFIQVESRDFYSSSRNTRTNCTIILLPLPLPSMDSKFFPPQKGIQIFVYCIVSCQIIFCETMIIRLKIKIQFSQGGMSCKDQIPVLFFLPASLDTLLTIF